jgi:DNA-directed RNA polymerase II subunit RPB2
MSIPLKEKIWRSIDGYFDENGLLSHQIESYNSFIQHGAQMVINANKEIKSGGYTITFGNLFFLKPTHTIKEVVQTLYPTQCILYNTGYMSRVFIDITVQSPSNTIQKYEKVEFGEIPVMVLSCLCNLKQIYGNKEEMAKYNEDFYDSGGYFIVKSKTAEDENKNSQRKILVGQEQQAFNRIYIFTKKKKPVYSLYSEIRSCSDNGMHSTTTSVGLNKDGILEVLLPWIDASAIPLGIVFMALGILNYKKMCEIIFGNKEDPPIGALELLNKTFEFSYNEVKTQESALLHIGKKGKKFAKSDNISLEVKKDAVQYSTHLLEYELFPHLSNKNLETKTYFIGYMTKQLILTIFKKRKPDDRDHTKHRRDKSVDALLTQQMHSAFRRLRTDLASHIEDSTSKGNRNINVLSWLKTSILTNYMTSAIVSNNWGAKGVNNKSISQLLEQFNFNSSFSSGRKLIIPMKSEGGKVLAPRDVHGAHFHVKCPAESPEGRRCGLITNLSLAAKISVGTDPTPLKEILKHFDSFIPIEFIDRDGSFINKTKILVNGDWIGFTKKPNLIVTTLRKMRRRLDIHSETSITYSKLKNEIIILTENGRFIHPVFIVDNGKFLFQDFIKRIKKYSEPGHTINFNTLLENGIVEMIDPEEMENCSIAGFSDELENTDIQYTHIELHPSLMYGVGAQTVPFAHHNQSPRIAYQAGMNKQAIGIPFTNYRQNLKGSFHVLNYLQKPLVMSRTSKIIKTDLMPSGQNAITLVNSEEFNEEDSLSINKMAIQRGFMTSTKFTTYYLEARPNERFKIPICQKLKGSTAKLTEKGVPKKGTILVSGDTLIGKVQKKIHENNTVFVDKSIVYEGILSAVVDGIMWGINGEGYEFYKVSVAETRTPMTGDKYSSSYGQKGLISMIYNQVDLPFSARDGTTPDIIINSLAFPSRMTIGMLLEMLTGKLLTSTYDKLHTINVSEFLKQMRIDDDTIDATGFERIDLMGLIREAAISLGFQSFGDEMMYNGTTGEPFKGLMFIGPVYYQKLKHMAIDKVHFRSRGPKTGMYRQPVEGRAQGGGIRAGVMERDCLLGQGVARFTNDRFIDNSDKFFMFVCNMCGLVPRSNIINGKPECCTVCGCNRFTYVKVPYASKLFMQELMGMNIVPRLIPISRN